MAPRPSVSIGIQPQIALYTAILGSVCAFGWYTEKYRRDEGDLDGHIKKMYLRNAQEASSKMPQMAAAIRGQAMDLDGRMDKMVWGGKAQLKNGGSGGTNGTAAAGFLDSADDESTVSVDDEKRTRKRKKRKRKKDNAKRKEEEAVVEEQLEAQQRNLVLKSSVAGVAVGAVTVAAVSVLLGGGGKK